MEETSCTERARKSTGFKIGAAVCCVALLATVIGISASTANHATGSLPDAQAVGFFVFSDPVQVASSAASVEAFCTTGLEKAAQSYPHILRAGSKL